MTNRIDLAKKAPKVYRAMIALDAAAREGLDEQLAELVRIRASQLNHCAYCINMHTVDARKGGESEARIYLLNAWEEAGDVYTEKEQAALRLTEAITVMSSHEYVSDEVYEQAAQHFGEEELAQLIALIFTINSWNRIAVSTRKKPAVQ
ncbi:carboxymuconolactone decarboxylase family protein [Lentzea albidocapillata]|uniref:Alkylhydroperoxidase AhpD family core domain-containing protein n=1 Tax=Lentzea albidocapillata TaxID=40571 RepID=A0A1W2FI00_9PSEU|nr:carboxymuconolactone decarboxylase family protein [Lentzea albidocapillata]SMD21302.1 alkylhydroperoxidase AhpD family core domain-containing protein [Lentzea albidocapillata]